MNPRVSAARLINDTEQTVLLIVFAGNDIIHTVSAVVEVYKILCICGGGKVAGNDFVAVLISAPVEKFVIQVGNYSDITTIEICAVVNTGVINPSRGFIENGGDKRGLALVVY